VNTRQHEQDLTDDARWLHKNRSPDELCRIRRQWEARYRGDFDSIDLVGLSRYHETANSILCVGIIIAILMLLMIGIKA
jgi:hypothetical protein